MMIDPDEGGTTPPRIFIKVDLPAPFSPIRPKTSPLRTVRSTPRRAITPGYVFVIERNSRRVSDIRNASCIRKALGLCHQADHKTSRGPALPHRTLPKRYFFNSSLICAAKSLTFDLS